MRQTLEEAVSEFQALHGGDWYFFMNSPLWKAAKAILDKHGPDRKLVGIGPQELIANGTIYAANVQGWRDVLDTMEQMMVKAGSGSPVDPLATYLPEEFSPPEPPPQPPAVATVRRPRPSPKPPKKK